jgi:hypothetical protein
MTTYTEAELFAAVQAGYHAPDDLPLATRSWLEGYRAGRSTPQPVVDVNQQLVEALQAVLDCGSTSDQWWIDKAREALLSAGKGGEE